MNRLVARYYKNKLTFIIGICPVLFIIIWFVNDIISGVMMRKNFFELSHNSVMIISSESFDGRTIEFKANDGTSFFFMSPIDDKFAIGDSIVHLQNSYFYDVYRKSPNGIFQYFTTYSYIAKN